MKNRILISTLVVLAVVALVFFFWKTSKESTGGEEVSEKERSLSSQKDPTMDPGGADQEGFLDDGASRQILLDRYLEWAEYPPNSRPASNLMVDIANPNFVESSPDYLFDPGAKDPNGSVCLFQPQTWAVIGMKDALLVTLECRDKERNRLKISIDSHQVFREWEGQKFGTVSADVNDNGSDGDAVRGDNIYTFSWRPRNSDWGQMSLQTEITYGPENKKAKLFTAFFSSPQPAGEFTGVFNDSVQDGSLSVKAVVQVYKKGKYHIEANLKDSKSGELIGYSVFDGELKAGTQEVEFIFFGKVLRDKDFDGPYSISGLRGHRVNLPIDPDWFSQGEEGLRKIQAAKTTEPDRELLLPYKEEFKTKPYQVETFSKAKWDSREKQDRIRVLQGI